MAYTCNGCAFHETERMPGWPTAHYCAITDLVIHHIWWIGPAPADCPLRRVPDSCNWCIPGGSKNTEFDRSACGKDVRCVIYAERLRQDDRAATTDALPPAKEAT